MKLPAFFMAFLSALSTWWLIYSCFNKFIVLQNSFNLIDNITLIAQPIIKPWRKKANNSYRTSFTL